CAAEFEPVGGVDERALSSAERPRSWGNSARPVDDWTNLDAMRKAIAVPAIPPLRREILLCMTSAPHISATFIVTSAAATSKASQSAQHNSLADGSAVKRS